MIWETTTPRTTAVCIAVFDHGHLMPAASYGRLRHHAQLIKLITVLIVYSGASESKTRKAFSSLKRLSIIVTQAIKHSRYECCYHSCKRSRFSRNDFVEVHEESVSIQFFCYFASYTCPARNSPGVLDSLACSSTLYVNMKYNDKHAAVTNVRAVTIRTGPK